MVELSLKITCLGNKFSVKPMLTIRVTPVFSWYNHFCKLRKDQGLFEYYES